jgi:hypothetical protein
MSEADAADLLDAAVDDGLAVRRVGRISGYTLTAAGRARHADLVARETTPGERAAIGRSYEEFLRLNPQFLTLCTEWQVHSIADAASRLAAVDDAVQPICVALSGVLDRFATYGPRLGAARRLFAAGERDWLTKPLVDSYHTVWFELHEDLLCTLGIDRAKEDR